ncbi:MAG: hypothetical protein AB7Q42_05515 [Acidimicrobiia bacterium]
MTLASILAVSWEPEIRGIITVLIGFVALCGSTYLLLATNTGARLGFLIAFAGLFGWMFIMGSIWWVYGIGLKGPEPSWKPASPVTVVRDGDLVAGGVTNDADPTADGWTKLPEDDPGRGQAVASADEILQREAEVFAAGEYVALAVYDKGGESWPKLGDKLDFIAFRHDPHYALVEVQAVEPLLTEPGRAPLTPAVDPSQPKTYVLMLRDLGAKRQPSVFITLGSGLIFGLACLMLHRRDRLVVANRSAALEPATVRS